MEAPEFFQGNYSSQFAPEKHHSFDSKTTAGDHFVIEELLDFSNEDAVVTDVATFDNVTGNSTDSSTVTVSVVDSCNSSSCDPNFSADIACRNFANAHFSSDLCVPPLDDLAELEWMSNFVEESFSCEDLQKLQLISGMKASPDESSEIRQFQPESDRSSNNNNNIIISSPNNRMFNPEMAVPAKARSKRSRAAPGNWASRLLVLSQHNSSSDADIISTGPPPPPPQQTAKKTVKTSGSKKKDCGDGGEGSGEGRKCLHCATDKTPQWRTGPMGPKTLCNACGVRYKSGRLVPEYRPAASPTFVLTKHSNSHRKVLELRRQKEMLRAQQQQQQQQQQFLQHHHQNMMFDISNGDDYLIHQHVGPDFRQLI